MWAILLLAVFYLHLGRTCGNDKVWEDMHFGKTRILTQDWSSRGACALQTWSWPRETICCQAKRALNQSENQESGQRTCLPVARLKAQIWGGILWRRWVGPAGPQDGCLVKQIIYRKHWTGVRDRSMEKAPCGKERKVGSSGVFLLDIGLVWEN